MSTGKWREVAIGDIADIVGGSTPSTQDPDNFGGDIPWLTPKDLSGPHDRYIAQGARHLSQQGLDSCSAKLLPTGAVLLSTRAPVGYVAIAKNPIATNQGFRSLIVREGVSAEYLYYWLSAHTEELERHASGSTFRELSGSALKSIKLRLPPLGEQRRIAGVLGGLDDKIELNRRMAQTLEQIARALFRSWFVDFEPVRAKQAQRWSPGQSLPGLPAQLRPLFPDQLEPSPQGPIPQGWRAVPLDEIATFRNGLALQKFPAQGPDSLPAIKIAQLRAGHTERADPVSPDIPSEYVVNDGDILFSWSGSLELVVWAGGKGALNQHLFKVEPLDCPDWFVYHWVERHLPEFRQIAADKATTMGHIKRHHLTDALVAVPPLHLLGELHSAMASPLAQANAARVASRQLAEMRDRLLRHLTADAQQRQVALSLPKPTHQPSRREGREVSS